MPFFKKYKIKNKIIKECASLQVQRSTLLKKRKRVFLSTLLNKKLNAGMTIETTIVIAITLYLMLSIMGVMMMFDYMMNLQIDINNIVKSTTKRLCYVRMLDKVTENNQSIENLKNKIKGKVDEENVEERDTEYLDDNGSLQKIGANVYFYRELSQKFGHENLVKNFVDLTRSTIDYETGMVDLIAIYDYKTLVAGFGQSFLIVQRTKMKAWVGNDIQKEQEFVYITPKGRVYHTNKDCSHLNFNIRKVMVRTLEFERNNTGSKYYACTLCCSKSSNKSDWVFITDDGNKYHNLLECGALSRSIITIDRTEVGERKLCSECGGQE